VVVRVVYNVCLHVVFFGVCICCAYACLFSSVFDLWCVWF